jgi:UDP-N-acetylmuramate--alanine ligase
MMNDGTFLDLGAEAVVVTNVEPDHLDHYGTADALVGAFDRFVTAAPGARLVCADDPLATALARRTGATTYGTSPGAEWRITDVTAGRASVTFSIEHDRRSVATVHLPVPGVHNARNACAALAMAVTLGAPVDAAVRALERYAGVARRYQFRGEAAGVTCVDDYAHLPTAVACVLATARQGGWRRVVAVFQPHRYTRTAALGRTFADAFVDADLVVVTAVYPAGEAPVPGVTGKLVSDAVLDAHPAARVAWLPVRQSVLDYLVDRLRPGDVCLTLGAGDLTSLPDDLLDALEHRAAESVR